MKTTEQRYGTAATVKKSMITGSVAGSGAGLSFAIYAVAKYKFGYELSQEECFAITAALTAGIAGIGRAIENLIRWYAEMKRIVK